MRSGGHADLDQPLRELVVVQVHEVAAKDFPLAHPRVIPERPRVRAGGTRKGARRIDVVPVPPLAPGEAVHVGERQRLRPPVGAQVGHVLRRLACVGAGAREPFAELAQRARVVVVPLALGEERIEVGVRIEVDADEERRIRARERDEQRARLLEIALLVVAHVVRVDVERQRAREFRRLLRARQVLQLVVGHHLVVLVPLAVGGILLELVVDVPLRDVAVRIGPDAAVERHEHRQVLRDRVAQHRVQRIVADAAFAALARRVPVGVERVVARGALGHPQVQDRHAKAAAQRRREVRRVDGVELVRAAQVDAGQRGQQVEGGGVARRERCPPRQRGGLDQAAPPEHRLAAVVRDGDDRERAAVGAGGRGIAGEVAGELEAALLVAGDARLRLRDVGSRDAGGGGKAPAVDADLDRAHARRVERPSRDGDAGADHRLGRRRVDVADRSRRDRRGGRRDRRGRRGRALAVVRDERPDLEAGDGGDDGEERGKRAPHAAAFAPARAR